MKQLDYLRTEAEIIQNTIDNLNKQLEIEQQNLKQVNLAILEVEDNSEVQLQRRY